MCPTIQLFNTSIRLYDVFNILSGVALLVCNIVLVCKRKWTVHSAITVRYCGDKRTPHNNASLIEAVLISGIVSVICAVTNKSWAAICTKSNANYFGVVYFFPIAFVIVCMLLRIPPLQMLDQVTPSMILQLAVGKISCFFQGCCYGKEISGGFYYSVNRERYEIPIQLIEILVAAAIFCFIRWYQKRTRTPGQLFSMYILLYSTTRFLTEFMRDDFPPIMGYFNIYGLQCIVGIIWGAILMEFVIVLAPRIPLFNKEMSAIPQPKHRDKRK